MPLPHHLNPTPPPPILGEISLLFYKFKNLYLWLVIDPSENHYTKQTSTCLNITQASTMLNNIFYIILLLLSYGIY